MLVCTSIYTQPLSDAVLRRELIRRGNPGSLYLVLPLFVRESERLDGDLDRRKKRLRPSESVLGNSDLVLIPVMVL